MPNHILVPLDGSHLAECVLPHAAAIARAFESQVTLLRVLAPTSPAGRVRPVDPLDWHIAKTEAQTYLDKWTTRLWEAGTRADNALVEGSVAERIIEFAHTHDVNLLILSSHGQSGLSGWNVSSIVQKVILRAYMPMMIVRAYRPVTHDLTGLRYQRLLVPLDGSQRAECALPPAITLARSHEARLLLAHVAHRPEMLRRAPPVREDVELADRITKRNQVKASKYLEKIQTPPSLEIQTRLLINASAAAALHELIAEENVDLVVLSAHGHSGGTKWPYGSVALNLVTYGTSPLLIVQDLSPAELAGTPAEAAAGEHRGH